MLYTKLKELYKENNLLREKFDFDTYYPCLQNYIAEEIRQGNPNLSPYRFAKMHDLDEEFVIKFFLGISSLGEDGIIKLIFNYECESCQTRVSYAKHEMVQKTLLCNHCHKELHIDNMRLDNIYVDFILTKSTRTEFEKIVS